MDDNKEELKRLFELIEADFNVRRDIRVLDATYTRDTDGDDQNSVTMTVDLEYSFPVGGQVDGHDSPT